MYTANVHRVRCECEREKKTKTIHTCALRINWYGNFMIFDRFGRNVIAAAIKPCTGRPEVHAFRHAWKGRTFSLEQTLSLSIVDILTEISRLKLKWKFIKIRRNAKIFLKKKGKNRRNRLENSICMRQRLSEPPCERGIPPQHKTSKMVACNSIVIATQTQ